MWPWYLILALLMPVPALALKPGEPAPVIEAPLPALEKLYRQYRDQGFTVLAVNVDTERVAADRMLKRIPVSYPVVFDPEGIWPARYAVKGMPSGYLLDRDGTVGQVKSGYRSKDFPQLESAILKALEAQP